MLVVNGTLGPDDSFPRLTILDRRWHGQLQEAINKIFADTCGPIIKALLSDCQWHFAITSRTLDFVIHCQTSSAYWQIIGEMEAIAAIVENIANDRAIIAVFPPDNRGVVITIEVREILAN
jgi:hypothetical protein